jgi:hypothetical protein
VKRVEQVRRNLDSSLLHYYFVFLNKQKHFAAFRRYKIVPLSSGMKMYATGYSETLDTIYRIKWLHILKGHVLMNTTAKPSELILQPVSMILREAARRAWVALCPTILFVRESL